MDSVLDRNALDCSLRYRTSVDCISKLEFAPRNINRYVAASQADLGTGALVLELLQFRDGLLTLSNDNFDKGDIAAMIMIMIEKHKHVNKFCARLTINSLRISGRLFAFLLFFTCFFKNNSHKSLIAYTMLISLPAVVL